MLDFLRRKPHLIVHSRSPYNAEPPLDRLRAAFLTPQADFYVRSHGDIPDLDASAYRLQVGGAVTTPLDLSLDALRSRFDERTVTAVMQCAGNRRADLQAVKPVSGDPWAGGAIGNATWTGVALADVLRAADVDEATDRHVAFTAHDTVKEEGENFAFAVSIPLAKAMTPDVLLAFAMNGEPLAPEHGHPLRVVVPGYAGVRSPKWLAAITVQDEACDSPIQQADYKFLPSQFTKETLDWSQGMTIDEMPLNAAICEPARYAEVEAGPRVVRGYAIATGRAIARVDVSADGGRTWMQAEIEARPDAPWAWTFWSARVDLPQGERELVVRAFDAAGQTQPERPDDTWNFKGYLSAAWHRVPIRVG